MLTILKCTTCGTETETETETCEACGADTFIPARDTEHQIRMALSNRTNG